MKNRFKITAAFLTVLLMTLTAAVPVFAAEQTFGEKMAAAGRNTVIGLCVVFVILLALSFIISLFRFIPKGNKKAEKNTAPEYVNKTAAPVSDDEELIAVIMAAIAASEGEAYDPTHYRLKSIKRVKTSRGWNRARR